MDNVYIIIIMYNYYRLKRLNSYRYEQFLLTISYIVLLSAGQATHLCVQSSAAIMPPTLVTNTIKHTTHTLGSSFAELVVFQRRRSSLGSRHREVKFEADVSVNSQIDDI